MATQTQVPTSTPTVPDDGRVATPEVKGGKVWGVLRLIMGWTFLWAFVDKLFALGFSTGRNPETGAIAFFGKDAWINGGSPTEGVLVFATKGPFKGLYQSLGGCNLDTMTCTSNTWIDWVFMISMLLIGVALLLGVAVKLSAWAGAAWMVVFYTATAIWPEHNPMIDEHVLQFVVLIGLAVVGAGRYLGFGKRWAEVGFVKRHPIWE